MKKLHIIRVGIWLSLALMFIGHALLQGNSVWPWFAVKIILLCSVVFYANAQVLMPRFLFRHRYVAYVGGILALVAVLLLVLYALTYIFDPARIKDVMRYWYIPWVLPILGVLFASTVYAYLERDNATRKRTMDLSHQNIEFEMKFLKSQINPHFLFNALNNIYALAVIKSERTPDMILKLSDMLRYTLYGSESKKVKIGREIEYINNFIEFQKLKMDSEPNITVDTSGCNSELLIEPMLMIPFIENSFKHGNIDNAKKGWLQVEIKTLGPTLVFKVKNSLPSIAINKDVVGGIGVENVRKRLDILYPQKYSLDITTTDSAFNVVLTIET